MFLFLFYFIWDFKKCEFVLSLMNVWIVFLCMWMWMCDLKSVSDMDTDMDMVLVMAMLDIGSIRLIWT